MSRFGRNYLETGNYLERIFPYLGVRFIAVNDHFDTLTAERSNEGYIVPLKNIINAAYSKDISRKSSSALRIKQQNGEFIGSWAPYGYKKCAEDRHKLEPDEETAPIVRRIFEQRCAGASHMQIARQLNHQGILSPAKYRYSKGEMKSELYANSKWLPNAVRSILCNETYLGHIVQGRLRTEFEKGQKQHSVPKEEWIIVRNMHTPLVDEETFHIVQQMAQKCKADYQERMEKHDERKCTPNIFRGLIFCADCKRPMVCVKGTNFGKKITYRFGCLSYRLDSSDCLFKSLGEEKLKAVLWDVIQQQIALAESLEKLMQEYIRTEKAIHRKNAAEREIAAARQAESRAKRLYDSLYQNYVEKLVTETEYAELRQKYRTDMERAKARLTELEQQSQARNNQTENNIWLTTFQSFQGETELTEEMTHALIERIEVDAENHISVSLRYQDEYLALSAFLKDEGKAVVV